MSCNLLSRAANPKQYDLDDLNWENELGANTSKGILITSYLEKYNSSYKDKSIFDIGSGTGWTLNMAKEKGAKSVEGIDPSEKNISISKKLFPNINVTNCNLESFCAARKYDFVLAIFVLNHIKDLNLAFQKISNLLNYSGELLVIVPDYNYAKIPRYDYGLRIEEINENEYVAQVKREMGVIADVVRKSKFYIETAQKHGLELKEEISMHPTENFILINPKYTKMRDVVLANLFVFKKYKNNSLSNKFLQ